MDHLVAAIGGQEAVTHNNRAEIKTSRKKTDANIRKITASHEEMKEEIKSGQAEVKSTVRTIQGPLLVAGFPRRRPGFEPGSGHMDLWWTKWRWGRFSPSISVSPANFHSTNCSTITIIYHLGLVQ
jgi:hypothetical protein